MTRALPFPGRELADAELERDPCFARIPVGDRALIVEAAWAKGAAAADMVFAEESGQPDFTDIASRHGLKVIRVDKDYVVGNDRYFSDYLSGTSTITLYGRSIALWADANGLGPNEAERVILAHEYCHFLEWTRLGLTSRDYQIPMLRLGPFALGRTGIRALSEIGAHAFAHRYDALLRGES